MTKIVKALVLALPLLGTTGLFAAAKKDTWQCVDSNGKEVAGVKSKKTCTSPNKWTKAPDHAAAEKASTEAPK